MSKKKSNRQRPSDATTAHITSSLPQKPLSASKEQPVSSVNSEDDWYATLHYNPLHYFDSETKTQHATSVDLKWFDLGEVLRLGHSEMTILQKPANRFPLSTPRDDFQLDSSSQENLFKDQESADDCLVAQFKYWQVRKLLFSRYNRGVHLDACAWYSVTPELIARQQVLQLDALLGMRSNHYQLPRMQRLKDTVVWDVFAGVGGNAIQLGLKGRTGICIATERSGPRLQMLQHNAAIYECAFGLECVQIDVRDARTAFRWPLADMAFVSPPWGGPDYNTHAGQAPQTQGRSYNFDPLERVRLGPKCDGRWMHGMLNALVPMQAHFLPRHTNLYRLAQGLSLCAEESGHFYVKSEDVQRWMLVESEWLDKKLKGITVYSGFLDSPPLQ